MKAIRVRAPGGIDHLIYDDIADPGAPGPGQIRVELHASSLNYHDFLVVIGRLETSDGRIPMSDGAGIVTAVGAGVDRFAIGDRVISTFYPDWFDGEPHGDFLEVVPGDRTDGFACEHVVGDARSFVRAPDGFSHAEAATLPCAGLTAWRALVVEGRIKPGDIVVTQGTGGVSIFALQIAKLAGATVIATSSSDAKLDRLTALGADHVLNYRKEPEWGVRAREIAGGDGVDHVVEVGGAGTLPQSIQALRNDGHLALIGVLAGFSGEVPTHQIMARQIRVRGITVGSTRMLEQMTKALTANHLRPVIDRSFALSAVADAFAYQESGNHFGKIVLQW